MHQSKINIALLIGMLLSYSTILSAQWDYLGLSGLHINKIKMKNEFLYVSTETGIYKKDLNQADTTWIPIGLQNKSTFGLMVINSDTIFASVRLSGMIDDTISIFRTTNGGQTWNSFQNGFGGNEGSYAVLAFEHSPAFPNMLFSTGLANIAKSTDLGESWRLVWGDWDGVGMGTHFVKIDPIASNIIWAGGEFGMFAPYLLKSTDFGESWKLIALDAGGDNACYSIAIDRSNSNIVYVGMEGRIIKTTDGGDEWSVILSPNTYPYFFALAANPFNSSLIYAAGAINTHVPQELVLYKSENGGNSWSTITHGSIRQMGVIDFWLSSRENLDEIYLATMESGVYKYTNKTTNIEDDEEYQIPETILLQQNYPNPFNNTTTIEFSIPTSGMVTLKVLNLLGETVSTVVANVLSAGKHSFHWEAKDLSSGVYLYQLKTASSIETKKLIILK